MSSDQEPKFEFELEEWLRGWFARYGLFPRTLTENDVGREVCRVGPPAIKNEGLIRGKRKRSLALSQTADFSYIWSSDDFYEWTILSSMRPVQLVKGTVRVTLKSESNNLHLLDDKWIVFEDFRLSFRIRADLEKDAIERSILHKLEQKASKKKDSSPLRVRPTHIKKWMRDQVAASQLSLKNKTLTIC